jgi:hypothetical protein
MDDGKMMADDGLEAEFEVLVFFFFCSTKFENFFFISSVKFD